MIEYKTNAVTTDLDEKFLKSLSKEEKETMLDYTSSIVFLQNLIAPDRKYARDLERWDNPQTDELNDDGTLVRELDPKGRIRVDLSNPHILEDVNYFREAAIHFETHGVYTLEKFNTNPYGEYMKFWQLQIKRCWEGMVRESDGEWITGYHYFYLNFSPIRKSIKTSNLKSKKVNRSVGLPDFYDGDYWFFHYVDRARENGKHCGGLKKRGAGYSLKGAAMLGRNFILGESRETSSEVVSLAIANEKEYLTKDGILNKFVDVLNHNGKTTAFPNRRELKDSWQSMHWQLGWKDNNTNLTEGSQNEVIGVTLKNDAEKARGKRAQFILWEEFGKFSESIKAWNIGRPSVEDGEYVFGQMCFWGTGGTATAAFTGLRTLFYEPNVYNVYELDNVWDRNVKPGSKCAFFHSGYLNQSGYMDANGNSDVIASLISVIKKRIVIKYHSSEASTLPQMIAEMALTPQEAIMKVYGSIFPTADILDYLEECRINQARFTESHLVGDLIIKDNDNISLKINHDKIPIRQYKNTNKNVEGAIEIFAIPQIDRGTQRPYLNRYIAGIDPIDNDYTETGSLGSIFIFDLWNDEIVAEYTGRPQLAEDFYEVCRKLLMYYNAVGNYENNIKGLFGYFNNKSCLHLLCDTPSYLRDVEEQKQNLFGNRSKGTRASAGINADALRLQKTYLLTPYSYGDEDNLKTTINLRRIRSLGYLEELYEFNPDNNFDRVSAMGMVMILRQERIKLTESMNKQDSSEYLEVDEFIKNNYDDVMAKI
jgi:hypothetical protein